jgi:hypothetical protein
VEPPLPAPTRSVLGFHPKHLHATPRTGRPSLLLSTATKHHHSNLVSRTKTSCPGLQPRNLLLAHADEPASRGTSSQDHWPCLLAAASHRYGPPSSICNTRRAAVSSSRACTRPDAPPPQHAADRRTTVPGQKRHQGPPPETLESQCQAPGARLPARPGLSLPGPDRALPAAAPRSPDLPWQPSSTFWSFARSAAARTPPHPPADLGPGPPPWLPLPCR